MKYYKAAVDLEPEDFVFSYSTGVLCNIKSDYPQGIKMLEKSIDLNKDNVFAYLALGDALERSDQIQKAINVFKELQSRDVTVHGLQ